MNKLFLDDVRTPPSEGWIVVRTADEAIERLKQGDIDFASLDHDLADGHYPWNSEHPYPDNVALVRNTKEKTGYNVVCWMEENDVWPPLGTLVHSQNPVGRERMEKVIRNAYTQITENILKKGNIV